MTGIATTINKIVSFGISIITVRLTFRYLGAERYGMWMTIASVVLLFNFADLGISDGLVNLVADALGHDDTRSARDAISSAILMVSGVAIAFIFGLTCAYPFLDTGRLFNVHSPIALHEAGPAFLVFFFCIVLNLPLGPVRSTQTGMQLAYINGKRIVGSLAASRQAHSIALALNREIEDVNPFLCVKQFGGLQ